MKRLILSVSMLGLFGLVTGCDDTTKKEVKATTETPTGKATTTTTEKTSTSGDMKPDAPKKP